MNSSASLRKKGGRKPLFYVITLFFPIIVLVGLEGSLRLFSYGPDLSLFTTEVINGRSVRVMNSDVKYRYFTHYQFSASLSPTYFSMPKPQGVYRIFCLGGSTTVGYPYWYNGSFSTFLRNRIRRIFPEKQIEVINVGMTATNSFTVLDMAKSLMEFEPDLFIVYDGHNEFYGALGYSSHENLGSPRWLTLTYLKLIHLKTFLLLREVYAKIAGSGGSSETGGTLMETLARGKYVPLGGDDYRNCLANFRANLADLKEVASSKDVPVILGTQASNLRDQTPFISVDGDATVPESRAEFRRHYEACTHLDRQNQPALALAEAQKAVALDPGRADGHYLLATCLDSAGRKRAALEEYRSARDNDQLRFRCSTDFNEAIRSASDGRAFDVADIEAALASSSPDSIIGKELILEHLHPNSRGYFLMAREFARVMRSRGYLAPRDEWARRDTIPDERLWQERSLTELDERIARRRTEILTAGWPFKSQIPTVDAVKSGDTLGQIVEQVTRGKWPWIRAHEAAADYYLGRKEEGMAEGEYRVIIDQFPTMDVRYYQKLAEILLNEKRFDDLRTVLLGSLKVSPTILAYRALGDISLNGGDPKAAAGYYEQMSGFPQEPAERVENGYLLALAYSRADMKKEAISELLRVLRIKPDYRPAVILLQKLNG